MKFESVCRFSLAAILACFAALSSNALAKDLSGTYTGSIFVVNALDNAPEGHQVRESEILVNAKVTQKKRKKKVEFTLKNIAKGRSIKMKPKGKNGFTAKSTITFTLPEEGITCTQVETTTITNIKSRSGKMVYRDQVNCDNGFFYDWQWEGKLKCARPKKKR